MDRAIPAVFSAGVFHPLEPVDLAQGTHVSVHCPATNGATNGANEESKQAWQDYLNRMESLPDQSPQDEYSNRHHDRTIYGA